MKYGLIGEHLTHSFSKVIHEQIGDYVYEIKEIEPQNVDAFMKQRDFCAINVTIPYKETVIPYLDYIDPSAKKIGAVNTVVNKNGKLYGYNTDYFGMMALVSKIGLDIKSKKVLVIGTGGTSKTATAVINDLGATEIIYVSNTDTGGALSYDEVYKNHTDIQIIFNTSPVGMYPKNGATPIDIEKFELLEGIVDVVYNPIRTNLVINAQQMGLLAQGGLYMLGAQAVYAYEYFMDTKVDKSICDTVYNTVLKQKDNIILTGMPSSGKTTIGKILASKTGKTFVDTDDEIIKKIGMDIPSYFAKYGEKAFRDVESEVIKEVSVNNNQIIATGGGAILREENITYLKQNGNIYFLNRDLERLIPTSDRPLSSDVDALKRRYDERYPIYKATADIIINGNATPDEVANYIYGEYNK